MSTLSGFGVVVVVIIVMSGLVSIAKAFANRTVTFKASKDLDDYIKGVIDNERS